MDSEPVTVDDLAQGLRLLAGAAAYLPVYTSTGVTINWSAVCFYCQSAGDHTPDCRWLRAAQILAKYDKARGGRTA